MPNKNITEFNKRHIYEKEVAPLIAELKVICELQDIPFFSCFALENTQEKTYYKYDGILTGSKKIILADDLLEKHICVANGFDVKPKRIAVDFEADIDLLNYIDDLDTSMESTPFESDLTDMDKKNSNQ